MATSSAKQTLKGNVREATAVVSVVGYAVVVAAFAGVLPIPDITKATAELLTDVIPVVNAVALLALIVGWRFIRNGDVRKHRAAMGTAFALILVFLVLYVVKVGGFGEKAIALEWGVVKAFYLGMLLVHVLLSVVSVPVVLYALLLGATHTPAELRTQTPHKKVGRIAAVAWILSLFLGIVTYLMLKYYGYTYMMR